MVSFDWDTAYHRAFGEDFGIDFFEGPIRTPKLEFAKPSDKSAGQLRAPKNTYLLDYGTNNLHLEALRKIEEKRAHAITQYDIFIHNTT